MKHFYCCATATISLPVLILIIYGKDCMILWAVLILLIFLFTSYVSILILKQKLKQLQQEQEFEDKRNWEEFRSDQYIKQKNKENKNQ